MQPQEEFKDFQMTDMTAKSKDAFKHRRSIWVYGCDDHYDISWLLYTDD